MDTRFCKAFFQKYCFQETDEDILAPPLRERRETVHDFFIFFSKRLEAAQVIFSRCKLSTR